MPFQPANISLIHRRCPGTSAARAQGDHQQCQQWFEDNRADGL